MTPPVRVLIVLALSITAALEPADARAGAGWTITFDWSPEICHADPGNREEQCTREHYFVLGGFAPLDLDPAAACAAEPLPEDLVYQASLVLPNRKRIQRMWKQEGACTGLAASEYVIQVARAARRWNMPAEFTGVRTELRMTPAQLRDRFVAENRDLRPDGIELSCTRKNLRSIGFCVDANFDSIACTPSLARRSCGDDVRLRPIPGSRIVR